MKTFDDFARWTLKQLNIPKKVCEKGLKNEKTNSVFCNENVSFKEKACQQCYEESNENSVR